MPMLTITASEMNSQRCQPEARGEKAERRADVVHAGDIEDRQHGGELEFTVVAGDVAFRDLIGEHDQGRQAAATRQPGRGWLSRSCEFTLLAGPFDVDDAARAKFRMPRIAADVRAQMPAAHALAAGCSVSPRSRPSRRGSAPESAGGVSVVTTFA